MDDMTSGPQAKLIDFILDMVEAANFDEEDWDYPSPSQARQMGSRILRVFAETQSYPDNWVTSILDSTDVPDYMADQATFAARYLANVEYRNAEGD